VVKQRSERSPKVTLKFSRPTPRTAPSTLLAALNAAKLKITSTSLMHLAQTLDAMSKHPSVQPATQLRTAKHAVLWNGVSTTTLIHHATNQAAIQNWSTRHSPRMEHMVAAVIPLLTVLLAAKTSMTTLSSQTEVASNQNATQDTTNIPFKMEELQALSASPRQTVLSAARTSSTTSRLLTPAAKSACWHEISWRKRRGNQYISPMLELYERKYTKDPARAEEALIFPNLNEWLSVIHSCNFSDEITFNSDIL